MYNNYSPSEFILVVERSDKKSISGYRITCDNKGNIKFKAMSIDYNDIKLLECVF